MSILIKGIDIPTYLNEDCVVVIRKDGKADVWQTGVKERTVEAIQIDRPHGRLIDGDKLSIEFENQCAGECADYCMYDRCVIIDDIAPTILEAEE